MIEKVSPPFSDTRYTYFEPHGLPSGGDWALQPQGAITLHGTVGGVIDGNHFTRLDGNAIFTGGYHRGLNITNNEFSFLGASAIASWGWTGECLDLKCEKKLDGIRMGPDGRGGDQAIGTYIAANIARELGLWQKQSSFYFQAIGAKTTLVGNVFFNGPRAALNFNGMHGMHTLGFYILPSGLHHE